jgi:hypothetical protein
MISTWCGSDTQHCLLYAVSMQTPLKSGVVIAAFNIQLSWLLVGLDGSGSCTRIHALKYELMHRNNYYNNYQYTYITPRCYIKSNRTLQTCTKTDISKLEFGNTCNAYWAAHRHILIYINGRTCNCGAGGCGTGSLPCCSQIACRKKRMVQHTWSIIYNWLH